MSATPNRASNTAKSKSKSPTLDLPTARLMLPLVRSIVADIVATHKRLGELNPEQDRLERSRRTLNWAARQRRYAIQDEISSAEKSMSGAVTELASLGVKLTDAEVGQVDFPTKINGRPAAFTWKLGEEAVTFWHYTGEEQPRPIPADWQPGTPLRGRDV
jgi:hypothetical protein